MEKPPSAWENLPVLAVLAYLAWSWVSKTVGTSKPDYAKEMAAMSEELEKRREADEANRAEMDAVLSAQEQTNAGYLKFLKQSDHPDAVAFQEHLISLQGRIARLRMAIAVDGP